MRSETARRSGHFVVTTHLGATGGKRLRPRVVQSKVWDGVRPFPVGVPVHSVLERTDAGVRVRRIDGELNKGSPGSVEEISFGDLSAGRFIDIPAAKQRPIRLTVYPVASLTSPAAAWRPNPMNIELPVELDRSRDYLKAVLGIAAIFAVGCIMLLLWHPQPPPKDEVLPARLAKLLLSPALKQKVESQNKADNQKPKAAYNVVQAFQTQAVQKTTSHLLNANVAKALLSKSTLLDASNSKATVRQLFNGADVLKKLGATSATSGIEGRLGQGSLLGKNSGGKGYAMGGTGPAVAGQGGSIQAVPSNAIQMDEGLTKDEVGKVIRSHLSEVRYCYESAMVKNSNLEGKLVVAFVIGGAGMVTESSTKNSSGDDTLDSCILSRLGKWKFPTPRGKQSVHVNYPFIFKVLGG